MGRAKVRKIFKVPRPDKGDEGYTFHPIVRIGRVTPFGYIQDPDDPRMLLPVEKELLLFEEAKSHLANYSLRDVAAWLSDKSGRSISHVGLRARVLAEQKREKEYLDSRRLAKQFRDAYHTAKRAENSRLGKREPTKEELDDELYSGISEIFKD